MNLLEVTDLRQVNDWKVRGVIMGVVDMGCIFIKYVYIKQEIYLIIPIASELYKHRGKESGKFIIDTVNSLSSRHNLFVKYV